MERFLILDELNTYYDLHLFLTALNISPPEPKTNYVELDGMSGTLDLTESLSGEVTYKDRTISATFWTDNGTYKERSSLFNDIVRRLHGKKIKIIEPDDKENYFYGRAKITSKENNLAYLELSLEATCEPWRYSLEETSRYYEVDSPTPISLVINNYGIKTVCPLIAVTGNVDISFNDIKIPLSEGSYKVSDIKIQHGVNVLNVSGNGSILLTYTEATL